MAVSHLGLKEASERPISSPADAVTLLDSALDNDLLLDNLMNVDPDAITQDLLELDCRFCVFLVLTALKLAPEALAAPRSVLSQRSGTDCELRWLEVPALGRDLLFSHDCVQLIETFFELINGRPWDILRACCLSLPEHCQKATRADFYQKLFHAQA